jgi:hypothetical protein
VVRTTRRRKKRKIPLAPMVAMGINKVLFKQEVKERLYKMLETKMLIMVHQVGSIV